MLSNALYKAVAILYAIKLKFSLKNLVLMKSLPVFRNRNERNLNLPYRRSSTKNRFAFREEGKKQITLSSNFLVGISRTEMNIRILN